MDANARPSGAGRVDWRDYQIKSSSREGESIEWTISYIYNRKDTASQRVLLVGDSICNGYQPVLRDLLADKCNITFWASSYCASDPAYLPHLDLVLSGPRPCMVVFNNGLHSLVSDKREWYDSYILAVKFLKAKLPKAKIVLLNCTKIQDANQTKVDEINRLTARAAEELGLPLLNIFSITDDMPASMWSDAYHFKADGVRRQAEFLAEEIASRLEAKSGKVVQAGTKTGPSGALK